MKRRTPTLRASIVAILAVAWAVAAFPGSLQGQPAARIQGILRDPAEIPSSFNPVGSGARALAMGGAFIAVADDATAASWNPGGLIQLERPEVSAVGAYLHRIEDIRFGANPESDGPQSVSGLDLNYLSFALPFTTLGHNMIVSLNYQHLFDLDRQWTFHRQDRDEAGRLETEFLDNRQGGDLYALGLAYAVQLLPELSIGATLNLWNDFLYDNAWTKRFRSSKEEFTQTGKPVVSQAAVEEHYSFEGMNFNVGFLWQVTEHLTVGGVFKSPFTADLKLRGSLANLQFSPAFPDRPPLSERELAFEESQEMDMPMSYGLGLAWRFSDAFTLSADFHRTHWNDFVLRDGEGREFFPISARPAKESDVDPTHHVRLGAEYLFIHPKHVVALRGGAFYDPVPAEGSPDDFFGLSAGGGFAVNRFSLDFAYQYRFGRDVGGYLFEGRDFSCDVDEHKLYASIILYF